MATHSLSKTAGYVQEDLEQVSKTVRIPNTAVVDDVIELIGVKAGWVIVDGWLSVEETPGGEYAVGDGNDPDRFITATDPTGNAIIRFNAPTTVDVDGYITTGPGYRYTVDDTIDVTLTSADSSGILFDQNEVISLTIVYYRDGRSSSELTADV